MKPNRVPDDLIQAGFDAIRVWYAAHSGPNAYLDDRTRMRLVLAAALTVHNEQVEQPLRERAEAAEAQLKALMQYTREIGEVQAGLPTLEAAMARASYWQALQRATAEGARRWQARARTAEGAWSAQQDIIEAERRRADAAERELAEVRERIGEGETPGSYCPWCGRPVRLDLDGLIPPHSRPGYIHECPGTHRRPSPEGAEERA